MNAVFDIQFNRLSTISLLILDTELEFLLCINLFLLVLFLCVVSLVDVVMFIFGFSFHFVLNDQIWSTLLFFVSLMAFSVMQKLDDESHT